MDPEKWNKIKQVVNDALELEPSERLEFLERFDAEIRAEVESLLAFEDSSRDEFGISAVDLSSGFFADDDSTSLAGETIGAYRIVSEIGEGGMGAVYLAERADGKFEQRVALKLLRREMNTAAFRRRFEQERTILAALEHPNIARLLDAGTTDDRIPFLAMEYIEGLPIDQYCRVHGLGLQERLNLFRKICAGVAFAHRNLVVHRDLKPSNILINASGEPKLLDFGISKFISEDFPGAKTATVTRLGAMTPSYASPEQLQSRSVTTATDIYSLGVILFELLSGHRPFESNESSLKEIYRAVVESEPRRPSAVISESGFNPSRTEDETVAFPDRQTKPAKTSTSSAYLAVNPRSVSGDLDNIVLKALQKEPERRYSSAEAFADDIRRHQEGRPIMARPNTLTYRAGKFVRRNLAAVIAAAAIAVSIIAGISATLWQARVARIESARAAKRFNDVRKLANSYIFDVYPEIENLEGALKAREKIVGNALAYLDGLSAEASDDLQLQGELATAYEKIGDVQGALNNSSLGNIEAGLESYRKARMLREAISAADRADLGALERLANNYYTTARTLWNNTETAKAEEMFEKGLKLRRELVAAQPASAEAKNRLAVLLIDYGAIPVFNSQTERAVGLFEEALAIVESLRRDQPENADFKKTMTRLLRIMSKSKGSLGDYEGGIRGLTQAVEVSRELAREFPNDFRVQRSVWLTNSIFCELYIDKQDGPNAVSTCSPTINFPKAALVKEPENGVVAYDLAISYFNTARAMRLAGRYSEVIENCDAAMAVMTKLSAKESGNAEYRRNLAIYETERARALIGLRQFDRALAGLQKTIEILSPIVESDPKSTTYRYDLSMSYRLSAQALFETGNRSRALESVGKAIEIVNRLRDENAIRDADKNLAAELENERARYSGEQAR
ncbi:MAG: serine/threonine protein kinase [Acidobacteria bacterium]|nr:serine/threonine protein kinase [Acidobacteriota bacterium]